MKAKFVYDGKAIDYTPTEDTPAGSVVVVGDIIGVTKLDIAARTLGVLHLVGVYDIEKASGAIDVGTTMYWDTTAQHTTPTATNNTYLGVAVEDAAASDSTVRVRIG
jgi:predicted RecA/RadA family phage recombinase